MGLVDDAIAQYGADATRSNPVDELIQQQQGGGVTSSSVDNLIAQYGKGETTGDEGITPYRTVNNVLWTLGLLDRPRNMLASGVANLVDDDPETGFLGGAKQGFMGDRQVSWGDVVGLPHGQSTDAWAPWLAKEAAHLAGDVVVDPLNLLFGAGAITKALGLSAKGLSAAGRVAAKGGETLNKLGLRGPIEYLAGSQWGKGLFNKAPHPKMETTVNEIMREGSRVPIEEEALAFDKALKASKLDQKEVFEAMERPAYGTPEVQAVAERGRKLQEMNREIFDEEQLLRAKLGMPVKSAIEEEGYLFMPRVLSGRGRWAMDQPGRELMNWVNPVTGEVKVQGALGKTKGLTRKIVNGEEQHFFDDVMVEPAQMSHKEVRDFMQKHKTLGPGEKAMDPFVESPAEALYAATINRQNKLNMLKIMDAGMEQGWLTKVTEPMELLKGSLTKGEPGGFLSPRAQERALKIPNMEGFKAPLPVANRLENLYNILEKPDKAIGAIEQLLQAFGKTRIGEMLNGYNTMWKRGMLAVHPGFHFANLVSNIPLMYLGGVRNPKRAIESGEVLAQTGRNAVEGYTNPELFRELLVRGGIDKRAAGLEAGGDVVSAFGDSQRIPFSNMITEKLGGLGPVVQKPFDVARQANDFGFKVGGTIENHARVTVALDWLKKNVDGVPTPKDLDAAVAHAKDFLFDYGDLTPMLQGLKQFFPFISWTRSIIGRTLKDLGTQPHELANIGRFVDTVFVPPTPEERATMDPWQRSQGPTMGALGMLFGTNEGLPAQFNMSRFIPHGTIEQLVDRPMQELGGMLAPQYKAAGELPYNKDSFRDRPIDELAGGPIQGVINPLTGGPYQTASQKLFGVDVPAYWQQAANYLPTSRAVNMVNAMARNTHMPWQDPAVDDPYFADPNQPAMTGWEKAMYLATGGKKYPYDELKLLSRREREDTKALSAAKSKARLAADKGDMARADFYQEQIIKLQEERDRARGMVEGGT